jgi:dTDP-4-amino-4,6-dideoxygalactose transaminase
METTQSLDSLAIFGAAPAFTNKLHVGGPNVGDRARFMERIDQILDSKWLTNGGPYVQEFERRIADLTQVKHCIAICNATVALEILIRALDLSGEVIVPSFTFVATANALQWQEITPVFCDLDPRTHTLDPNQVEQMITPRTTGIVGVHLWGHACDVESLTEIAARRGLKLIFDSAHAFGCSYHGRMIGAFGNAEVFSFHATKIVNSLEGGAVVTNDDELARKIRLMKNFGFTSYDQTSYIGINGKMNEVAAAMGLTNLESLDDFIAVNRRNYELYARELAGLEGIALLSCLDGEKWNYQYVVLDIDESRTIVTRDELIEILHRENVLARRYFYPGCHRMEPYRSAFPEAGLRLPETERLANRVLCLPTGTAVEENQISIISGILRLVLEHRDEIKRRLNNRSEVGTP